MATTASREVWRPSDAPVPGQARPQSPPDAHAHATVAGVAGQHGNVLCLARAALRDAAAMLIMCDRTAAVVVDDAGALIGALTENDVLRAYAKGVALDCPLHSWLHSNMARLPIFQVEALTVHPDTPLLEAAQLMREHASDDYASRHLVVRDEANSVKGVLSALDMARAICSRAVPEQEAARRIGGSTVEQVMKHKTVLPMCREYATMEQALEKMLASRQNCVLVGDDESVPPHVVGVFTTRDALRAFAEGIPLDVHIGHWLYCLSRELGPRLVSADAPVLEAAAAMAVRSVHHLVVVDPGSTNIAGVMSAFDLACALGSPERVVGISACDS